MTKSEKVFSVILIVIMAIEAVILAVLPVVKIIGSRDWSSLILWVFIPALAFAIRVFCGILKEERSNSDDQG